LKPRLSPGCYALDFPATLPYIDHSQTFSTEAKMRPIRSRSSAVIALFFSSCAVVGASASDINVTDLPGGDTVPSSIFSSDQLAEISQVRASLFSKIGPTLRAGRNAQKIILAELTSGELPNASKIDEAFAAYTKQLQPHLMDSVNGMLQIRAIVTPAQLTDIAAWHHPQEMTSAFDRTPAELFHDSLGLSRGANLSSAQSARLSALQASSSATTGPLRTSLAAASIELPNELDGPTPPLPAQLTSLVSQIADLKTRIAQSNLDLAIQAVQLLTPAQRAAVAHAKATPQ
jgi:hypothetical protein